MGLPQRVNVGLTLVIYNAVIMIEKMVILNGV
jgi:hypothetical protein